MSAAHQDNLLRQTLRTVAILVGACVLFVGSLSGAAVFVASRAVAPRDGRVELPEPNAPAVAKDGAKKPPSI